MQSLVVSDGGDRILLTCHAGCQARDVVAALNLGLRDLFYVQLREEDGVVNIGRVDPVPVPPAGGGVPVLRRPQGSAMMPSEHYIDGWVKALTPELQARLFEVKGWSARTLGALRVGWDSARLAIPVYGPDGLVWSIVRYLPGGTPKTLAAGPRELWPCPESFGAGEDVWLVEGEPDAISARELGLRAVSVPGVATWKQGWAERFRGRRVTVCFDCDAPGREAAGERVRELGEVGVEAASVDLFPGVEDGTDLGDLLVSAVREERVPELCRYLLGLEEAAWKIAA